MQDFGLLKDNKFVDYKFSFLNLLFLHLAFMLTLASFSCTETATSSYSTTSAANQTNTIAQLTIATQPSGGQAGSVWSAQPVVEIRTAGGALITSGPDASSVISALLYNSTGTLSGTVTVQAQNGIAIFNNLSIESTGNKQLVFFKPDNSLNGGLAGAQVVSNIFSITANSASKIGITSSDETDANSCVEIVLSILDENGNQSSLSQSTVVLLSNNGSAQFFSDSNCTSSTSGTVTFSTSDVNKSIFTKNTNQERVYFTAYDQNSQLAAGTKKISFRGLNINATALAQLNSSAANESIVGCNIFDNGQVNCNGSVISLSEVTTKVVASLNAKCVITGLNNVYCWGGNANGELGQGTTNSTTTTNPVLVNLGGPVSDIAAAANGFCAIALISNQRVLKCWGANSLREIGDGTTTRRTSPTVASSLGLAGGVEPVSIVSEVRYSGTQKFFVILSDGTVKTVGGGANPSTLAGFSNVAKIAAASNYGASGTYYFTYVSVRSDTAVCALLSNQTVRCMGTNSNGQLANGSTTTSTITTNIGPLTNITDVAVSAGEMCVLDSAGKLYCSGDIQVYTGSNFFVPRRNLTEVKGVKLKSIFGHVSRICGLTYDLPTKIYCRSDLDLWPSYLSAIQSPLRSSGNFAEFAKTKIKLSASAEAIIKGTCQSFTITHYKNDVIAAAEAAIEQINLIDTSGFGQFYGSSDCSTAITKSYLAGAASSRQIYYKIPSNQTSTGVIRLRAVPSDSGVAGSDYFIPVSGGASALGFTDKINLVDEAGNITAPAANTPLTISWVANSGGFTATAPGVGQLTNPQTLNWPANQIGFDAAFYQDSCLEGATLSISLATSPALTGSAYFESDQGGCGN